MSRKKKAAVKKDKLEAREGSKKAKVLALLRRSDGATKEELLKATGWKGVQGYLSEMKRKMGYKIDSFRDEGSKRRTYRIA